MKSKSQVLTDTEKALGTNSSDDTELSREAVFEMLSSRRRRYTLHYLFQRGELVTIRELSEQLAAWENHIDRQAVTPKQRKRVYTALHQTHLPRMDRFGVVEFDRDRGTIAMTDHVAEFDIYLDVVPQDDIPWSQFYLALGAVLLALVVAAMVEVPPFSYVGGFGYALFVAATLTIAGCVHTLRERRTLVGTTATPLEVEPPREIDE
ncbi:hypothetical protein EKH57_15770 [Halorubrum sp. BOL3-1]|uniref:DUF7344 domain-containing protein n=1 Tax=Halorubrum sp. BOL3-1 TaxID=2497325 RepID=UPI001004E118|nr:hypothetical protein [Halorubrum sp. BOL3-1]QAU14043.1 hypothetical protein EKH57_15770 [Halorubrum sp. BOL3-1]